mgnify:CR=1 FL=1
MFGEILLSRPELALSRGNDPPAGEHREQAGEVGVDTDGAGGDDGVVVGDTEHPEIESPVTGPAKGHAVADVIVFTFCSKEQCGPPPPPYVHPA